MNDQALSLRRWVDKENNDMQYKKAKTIAIISGKGGVGKSNFAINFSLELIKLNKTVLLLDLDVGMGNIDILLGMQANKTIIDMLDDRLPVRDIIQTGPRGLSYIAGGSGVAELFSMDQSKMDYFLEQYENLVSQYDYIIFDMGAGVTESSTFFILSADECIVVMTQEPTSITDAYSIIKHLVNKQQNLPIYIVLNRYFSAKSGKIALDKFKELVWQFLNKEIYQLGILPEDKIVSTAVMRQTPYVLLNERAPISRRMKQIAFSYAKDTSHEKNVLTSPLSFIDKLKQFLRER